MRGRGLAKLRKDAPVEDRNCSALAIGAAPPRFRPVHSRYAPANLAPQTTEQLERMCAPYGAAAVADAKWSAVLVWLMGLNGDAELSNPLRVVLLAVSLVSDETRIRLGFPSLTGKAFVSTLTGLSPAVQAEAEAVAADTLVDWSNAGSPGLLRAVERTHKYIAAFIRQTPPHTNEGTAA